MSDGSETPGRVVELAAAAGCSAVALTDHDSLAGLEEAGRAAARARAAPGAGVRGVVSQARPSAAARPGSRGRCTCSCTSSSPGRGPLQNELLKLRGDRAVRNRELAARLGELGTGITYEDVLAEAGDEGGMGRPHFARALVKAGAVEDIDDAFDRYLADGRPGYVPKARLDPPDVARLAHESGGVAVLAHPLSTGLNPQHLERMVAELAEGGLDGIEAVYSSYTPDQRSVLRRMAARTGLVATGGSDFHGSFKPGLFVGTGRGDLNVPDDVLDTLEARRG